MRPIPAPLRVLTPRRLPPGEGSTLLRSWKRAVERQRAAEARAQFRVIRGGQA